MPVNVDNFHEFEAKLVEAATTLGMRFVFGPELAMESFSGALCRSEA